MQLDSCANKFLLCKHVTATAEPPGMMLCDASCQYQLPHAAQLQYLVLLANGAPLTVHCAPEHADQPAVSVMLHGCL